MCDAILGRNIEDPVRWARESNPKRKFVDYSREPEGI